MQKFSCDASLYGLNEYGAPVTRLPGATDRMVYLASDVDARIAELEYGNKILRDELNKDESVMAADQLRIAELEEALTAKDAALLLAAGEIEDLDKALHACLPLIEAHVPPLSEQGTAIALRDQVRKVLGL